jgi:hypothetical protein
MVCSVSLTFTAANDSLEIRWIVYALIRDNVQHHLEEGKPGARFEAIHRAADALGGTPVKLRAGQLAEELAAVEATLLARPIAVLAMTARTRAVIHYQWPALTEPASEVVGPLALFGGLVRGAATLGDVFGETVRALGRLAATVGPDDAVVVTDN